VGWATVDIERTIRDLAQPALGPGPDEESLGGRSWRISERPVAVVLLEPRTEGQLAAALARRGEGIVALYLAADGPLAGPTQGTALGRPGRLMPHTTPWGPFVIRLAGDPRSPSIVPDGASRPGPSGPPAAAGE
jgi:hypothetical protein